MNTRLSLQSFRLKHFKAVRNSGGIRFTPLTAFIGNNGSGKSSIVEALETLQQIFLVGVDAAMLPWRGFEHVWSKGVGHEKKRPKAGGEIRHSNPMTFELRGRSANGPISVEIQLTTDAGGNKILVSGNHLSDKEIVDYVSSWQFLNLNPGGMTFPVTQKRTPGLVRLAKEGTNIAEYLQSIRDQDARIFDDLIDSLKLVLSYADDVQPTITSELERAVYLKMSERGLTAKVPGWLLSQGTLRILALLAVFRHPKRPTVVFIEEVENGLDPRTIHLVVDEIRHFVENGGQVVLTTHSPFLLDLLHISQIIVVERDEHGAPLFKRPGNDAALKKWTEKFAPGKLYTMGSLTNGR